MSNYSEWKAKNKAEREAKAAEFMKMVEVGSVFYSSWGYEQTNIDFYQVTKKSAKFITLRPIESLRAEAEWAQHDVMPIRDRFKTGFDSFVPLEGKRFKMQGYASSPCVSLCDFANAYLWDGKPKHSTSYA